MDKTIHKIHNLREEIARLKEELRESIKRFKKLGINDPDFCALTYKGRCISEARELGVGYCGSCSFKMHVDQLNDPDSWVHSSVDRWLEVALEAE